MPRRRIWEVNCFGLDAVLCTSFDPDELLALDPSLRVACDIPEHPCVLVPRSLIVYGVAHKSCHSDNPTSRTIERRLDAMHRRMLHESENADKVDVLMTCYSASEGAGEDLAGCLWTVLTDARSELRQQGLFWLKGLMIRSMTHWMQSRQSARNRASDSATLERD